MNKLTSFYCKFILGFWLALLLLPSSTFSQDDLAIGRIISTTGSVQARSATGDMRNLARRSEVFAQDTIVTGTDGFAQLRLIDAGMIAFRADTEFTFEEYSFDGAGGAPDNAIMSMVSGGFRTISGSIGDDDQDSYRIDTPFASIGIRGTTHEAVLDNNSLFTGVYDGGTTISNNAGELDTGVGANFDFSQTQQGQAPTGLLQQPDQLGQIDLNPGAGGGGDNDDDAAADDDENDDGSNGDEESDTTEGDDGTEGEEAADDNAETEENDNAVANDDGAGGDEGGDGDVAAGNDSSENDDGEAPQFDDLGTEGADENDGAVVALDSPIIDDGDTPTVDADDILGNTVEADINPTENVRDREELEVAGEDDNEALERIADEEAERIATEEAERIAAEEAERIAVEEAERIAAEEAERIAVEEAERIAVEEAERSAVEEAAFALATSEAQSAAEEAVNAAEEAEEAALAAADAAILATEEAEAAALLAIDTTSPALILAAEEAEAAALVANEAAALAATAAETALLAASEAEMAALAALAAETAADAEFEASIAELAEHEAEAAALAAMEAEITALLAAQTAELAAERAATLADAIEDFDIIPGLTLAETEAILSEERVGFIMFSDSAPEFDDNAGVYTIYSTNTSDPSAGEPILVSSNPLDPRTVNTESPDFIFRTSTDSIFEFTNYWNIYNSRGVVEDAYAGFSFETDIQTGFVNNESAIYTSNAVSLWVSAIPTSLADLTTLGTAEPILYTARGATAGSSGAGFPDRTAKSSMLIDFSDGSIIESLMSLPVHTCLDNKCQMLEEHLWEYGVIDSVINGGFLVSSIDASTSQIDEFLTEIQGNVYGIFTEENATTLIVGQNLSTQPGNSFNNTELLFIFEREDRLNSEEFHSLDESSLFVYSPFNNNFSLTNTDHTTTDALVITQWGDELYREVSGLIIEDQSSDLGTFGGYFDLSWERWSEEGYSLSPDRLDNTSVELIDTPAYLAIYTPSLRRDLQGRYSSDYNSSFTGENQLGDYIETFDISFNVDFLNYEISDGYLYIESYTGGDYDYWNIFFDGFVSQNQASFYIQEYDSSGTYPTTFETDYNGPFTNVNGSIIGSFIDGEYLDSGTPYFLPGFSGSFALDHESGAFVTGLFLLGGEIENRYSFEEGEQLKNLGFVLPTLNANYTLNGSPLPAILAGVSSRIDEGFNGYPVFVQTNLDFESDPFDIYFGDSEFVVRGDEIRPYYISTNTTPDYIMASDYDVAWGVWRTDNQHPNLLADHNSYNETIAFNTDVIWTTVSTEALAVYEGSTSYSRVVDFFGHGSDGKIGALDAGFDISFLDGQVSNGFLNICAGSIDCSSVEDTKFEISFEGNIGSSPRTPYLQTTILSFMADGVSESVNGELQGIFTAPTSVDGASYTNNYKAFVGGFNFTGVTDPSEYLTGTFLLEQEDRFDVADLNTFNNFGFVLPVDPASATDTSLIYTALADDSSSGFPTFIESDLMNPLFRAYDGDVLTTTGNVSDLSLDLWDYNYYFDIEWGLWDNSAGDLLVYTDPFDDNIFRNDLESLLWVTVPKTEIASFNGTASYDNYLFASEFGTPFIGTSALGSIDSVGISFDVDFSSAIISNGLLDICVTGAGFSCAGGINWQASFAGTVNNAVMSTTSLNVTRNGSAITDAALSGIFTANDADMGADLYRTFVGGFNFVDTVNSDFVTGAFVADWNPFFDSSLLARTIAPSLYSDDETRSIINVSNWSYVESGYGIDHAALLADEVDVSFIFEEYSDEIWFYELNQTFSEHYKQSVISGDDYSLEMAYWLGGDGEEGSYSEAYLDYWFDYFDYFLDDYLDPTLFNGPGFWVNYTPTTFSTLSGEFSTVLEHFGAFTFNDNGNPIVAEIDVFEVNFTVDFIGGSISDGSLLAKATDIDIGGVTTTLNAESDFTGIIYSGGGVNFTFSNTNYYETVSGVNGATTAFTTQRLFTDFAGNDADPLIVGGYKFKFYDNTEGANVGVSGVFAVEGFLDDRLSNSVLNQLDNNVALLAVGDLSGDVFIGRASNVDSLAPTIGINTDSGAPMGINDPALFNQPFEQIFTGTSTATEIGAASDVVNVSGFNVDWGFWNSNANNINARSDHLNATNVGYVTTTDVIWAKVGPSLDIADRTGEFSYSATGDFLGTGIMTNGNTGELTAFGMSFDVDFSGTSSNAISSGLLSATLADQSNGSITDSWSATFTGGIANGALAQFNGISGTVNGTGSIAGDINGVFTGTQSGSNGAGFVSAFSLNNGSQFIQGVGLLQGALVTPP